MSRRFDGVARCGFEGTAVIDPIRHPLDVMRVGREGVRAEAPMAADIDRSHARPGADVHYTRVERELARIKAADPAGMKRVQWAA